MYEDLLKYPNVVGAGIGYKEPDNRERHALVVMVSKKLPASALSKRDLVPPEAYGIRTDVIEVGRLIAHYNRNAKWRPCPGGVSVGHYKVSAGTLGCYVKDCSGKIYMLSNNHVIANQNDALPGDPIIQPGFYDGGLETDKVARLMRFVPMVFTESQPDCNVSDKAAKIMTAIARLLKSKHGFKAVKYSEYRNLVDAAVALMDSPNIADPSILEIGEIHDVIKPELGMKIIKSGRSSGLTDSEIVVLDATVTVEYDHGKSAMFDRVIVTGAMSIPGDSGSLLVHKSNGVNYAVGLLFGGSDKVTLHNPIELVLNALEVEL